MSVGERSSKAFGAYNQAKVFYVRIRYGPSGQSGHQLRSRGHNALSGKIYCSSTLAILPPNPSYTGADNAHNLTNYHDFSVRMRELLDF